MMTLEQFKKEPTSEFFDRAPLRHQTEIIYLAAQVAHKLIGDSLEVHGVSGKDAAQLLEDNMNWLLEGMARFTFHALCSCIGAPRDKINTQEELDAFRDRVSTIRKAMKEEPEHGPQ